MDEAAVRAGAEAHAQATVAGDFKVAGSYLAPEALAQVGGVMKAMPRTLTRSEVTTVEAVEDGFRVEIRYTGEDGAALVESRWADHGGRPMITGIAVL